MTKWIVPGVLVLALIAVAIFALVNLDSYLERNEAWLAERAADAIGRPVSFEGIAVSLRGGLGARVTGLRVGDDPAFSDRPFLRADAVRVRMAVLPALLGTYELRSIILERPELTIIHTARGYNVESLGRGEPAPPAAARLTLPAPPFSKGEVGVDPPGTRESTDWPGGTTVAEAAQQAPPPVHIDALVINGGTVHFIDRTASPPTSIETRRLDLRATGLRAGTPVAVDLRAAVLGADERNLHASGTVGPVGASLAAHALPMDLALEIGPLVIDDLRRLPALARALPAGLSSKDPIHVEATAKGTASDLALTVSLDGTSAALAWGAAFRKPGGTPLRIAVAARRSDGRIELKSASLALQELDLRARGTVRSAATTSVDLQIDGAPVSIAALDELLPPLAEYDLSGTLEAHVHASGAVGGGRLPKLEGSLSLTDVAGGAENDPLRIQDLTTEIALRGERAVLPPTGFALGGSPIEASATLKDFTSPEVSFQARSAALRPASLGMRHTRPDELLRDVVVDGTLTLRDGTPAVGGSLASGSGRLRDIDYRDLQSRFSVRGGTVTVPHIELRAFDGTYSGTGRYERPASGPPVFDMQSSARNIALVPLLRSRMSPGAAHLRGRLRADVSLRGTGSGWQTIQKTLHGRGRVEIADGVLKDVNIAEKVLSGLTGVGGLTQIISPRMRHEHPGLFGTADTRFDRLGATVRIDGGRVRTEDLTVAARDYTARGSGWVSLDHRLDITATLSASRELTDDLLSAAKPLRSLTAGGGRLEIPFRLTGTFSEVRVRVDSDFVLRALQRALVGEGLGELLGGKGPALRRETPGAARRPAEELLRKGLEKLFER
jgi:uncharacterized protein involved in outer membrane biogenesis